MTRNEWRIDMDVLAEYLNGAPGVTRSGDGWRFGDCRITLERLPERALRFGVWPATMVSTDGGERDEREFLHRFMLRFLKAGG